MIVKIDREGQMNIHECSTIQFRQVGAEDNCAELDIFFSPDRSITEILPKSKTINIWIMNDQGKTIDRMFFNGKDGPGS